MTINSILHLALGKDMGLYPKLATRDAFWQTVFKGGSNMLRHYLLFMDLEVKACVSILFAKTFTIGFNVPFSVWVAV
jgi:hypothetical protein